MTLIQKMEPVVGARFIVDHNHEETLHDALFGIGVDQTLAVEIVAGCVGCQKIIAKVVSSLKRIENRYEQLTSRENILPEASEEKEPSKYGSWQDVIPQRRRSW